MSETKVKDTYLSKYKAQLKSVKLTDDSKELRGEQLDKAIERVRKLELGGRMTLLRQIDSGSLYQHFVDSIEDAYMKNIVCADDMIYLKSKHKIVFSPDLTKFNNVDQDDKESVSTFISDIDGLNNEIDDAKEGEPKNIFATKVYDTETREVRKSFFNNYASMERDKGFPAESIEDAESMSALVRQHLKKGVGDADSAVDALERLRVVFYMFRFPHLADDLYDYFDRDVELMEEVCKKSVFYKNMSDCHIGKEAIEESRKGVEVDRASDCVKQHSLLDMLIRDISNNSFIKQPDVDYWTAAHILQVIASFYLCDQENNPPIMPTPYLMLVGQTSTGKDSRLSYATRIIRRFTSGSFCMNAMPASPQAVYDMCAENYTEIGVSGSTYVLDESGVLFNDNELNKAVSSCLTSTFGGKGLGRPRKASTSKKDEIVKFPDLPATNISLMTASQPEVMINNLNQNSEALTSGFLARFTCAYLESDAEIEEHNWNGQTVINSALCSAIQSWVKQLQGFGVDTDFKCGDHGAKIAQVANECRAKYNSTQKSNIAGKVLQKSFWHSVAVAAPSVTINDYDMDLSLQALDFSIDTMISLVEKTSRSLVMIDAKVVIDMLNGYGKNRVRITTLYRDMSMKIDPRGKYTWKQYKTMLIKFISDSSDKMGWTRGEGDSSDHMVAVGDNKEQIIKKIHQSKKSKVRVKRDK